MPISSIYTSIEDIPLILTPRFMSLKPIKLPADFNIDIPQLNRYDFNLERNIIAETERYREESVKLAQIRSQKLQAFQEARLQKQKEEARKIAPGYLDTDRRILTPVPVNSAKRRPSQVESGNYTILGNEESNYLEFEGQFSKDNQVTPIQDDISILKEVIRNSILPILPPTRPPKETIKSSSSIEAAIRSDDSNIDGNNSDNKNNNGDNNGGDVDNNTNSNDNDNVDNNDSEVIKQFLNMGFTREQAIDALEKYNYDVQMATNYLLDLQFTESDT